MRMTDEQINGLMENETATVAMCYHGIGLQQACPKPGSGEAPIEVSISALGCEMQYDVPPDVMEAFKTFNVYPVNSEDANDILCRFFGNGKPPWM